MEMDSQQIVWLCVIFSATILLGWGISFFLVAKYRPEELRTIMVEAYIARMLTVVLIVVSTSLLAIVDKLSAAEVTAILAGIAGYTLGSAGQSTKPSGDGRRPKEEE